MATPAEQRALLPDVFSSIVADHDGMTFTVRDLDMEFGLGWATPDGGGSQVAGPRPEYVAHMARGFALVAGAPRTQKVRPSRSRGGCQEGQRAT